MTKKKLESPVIIGQACNVAIRLGYYIVDDGEDGLVIVTVSIRYQGRSMRS